MHLIPALCCVSFEASPDGRAVARMREIDLVQRNGCLLYDSIRKSINHIDLCSIYGDIMGRSNIQRKCLGGALVWSYLDVTCGFTPGTTK